MKKKAKKLKFISETIIESHYIVLPSHTNAIGGIFGGVLMSWIDITAAICAQRHARTAAVTASIDALHFLAPARLGDVVYLSARVIHTGKSSMVIRVNAEAENPRTGSRVRCCTADLSFVALDAHSKPCTVPPIQPNTRTERAEMDQAAARRKILLDQLKAIKSSKSTFS